MSVQTTNTISKVILNTALESAAMGWAASVLSSPIGAAGGAAFGAIRSIAEIPLRLLSEKLLNTNNPAASSAAKTVAKAIVFFGSYAAAWGALAYAGTTLATAHIVNLTIMSVFTSIGIDFFLHFAGIVPADAR